MAARKSPFFDTATTLGKLVAFLGISALSGVLAAGLLVPVAAATGTGAQASLKFFEDLPAELAVGPLSQPSRIIARDGSLIATIYAENRQPVKLKNVSRNMVNALLAIEDDRFFEHGGVDMQGIMRAVVNNARNGSTQGASTLTQQYVNNVLIDSDLQSGNTDNLTISGSKTLGDKLREAKLAIAVEKKLTKQQILEGYLNIVPFSGTTFGIEAASKYFYGIPSRKLNIPQAALLAGLVNGPTLYSPTGNPELALKRRNIVLRAMLSTGKISQEQYARYTKLQLGLRLTPVNNGCVGAAQAPYFCDYVKNLILADPAYGKTREDRQKLLYRGGLLIKTTLDPRLQKAAQKAVMQTAAARTSDPVVGHSMVTVQPGTGRILTMAQNTNYNPREARGNTEINFNVDRYLNGDPQKPLSGAGGFQPGSTYKPFTLAAWLDDGRSLNAMLNGNKRTYRAGDRWTASCLPGGAYELVGEDWTPQNYGDKNYRTTTVLDGIANSLNTITFASARELDLCRIQDLAYSLGVHNGKSKSGKPEKLSPRPSNLIGAEDVAPLTMASAFAGFAANGKYCAPTALISVTSVNGNKYPVPPTTCRQAIREEVAEGVNVGLQAVMTRGSGQLLDIGVPVAGKTGTNDFRSQTWFVGYTTGLATASWIGNQVAGTQPLDGKRIGGRLYDEIDGSLIAGPSWKAFMDQVVRLYPAKDFTSPPAEMLAGPPVAKPQEAPSSNSDAQPAPPRETTPDTTTDGNTTDGNTSGGARNGNGRKGND